VLGVWGVLLSVAEEFAGIAVVPYPRRDVVVIHGAVMVFGRLVAKNINVVICLTEIVVFFAIEFALVT
jgi:hypothetical protein